MRVRLIQLTTRRSGAVARREQVREVQSFTFGRGTDNELVLNELTLARHHAAFEQRGSEIHLVRVDAPELVVNGQVTTGERVEPGDKVRAGTFELRVVAPSEDEQLAIEIEQVVRQGDEREELELRTRMGVEVGLITRRRLSVVGVLAVLVFFLAVPLLTGRFEGSWNTGPISRKHAFIADDCRACHTAFERVRNDGCLECHAEIANHASAEASPENLDGARCGECHVEHDGATGLADIDDPLCEGCHADLVDVHPGTALGDAADFDDLHPAFRLFVVTEPGAAREPAVWSPELRERSGVRFSHWRHVAQSVPVFEKSSEGGQAEWDGESAEHLRCDTCHRLDVGGKNMQPISFEQHCQSCHALGFDEALPGVEAVHGDLVQMREQLRGVYSERVLRGDLASQDVPGPIRFLRPGQELTRDEARVAMSFVEEKVAGAEGHLMNEPGECARCHALRPGEAADGGTGVAPVELANLWMPKSEFRHRTHAPFPCRDCHAAAAVFDPDFEGDPEVDQEGKGAGDRPEWSLPDAGVYALLTPDELRARGDLAPSESAEDVLIPRLEDCRTCHGGAGATPPRVASACVLCHPFHREEHGTIRDRTAISLPESTQNELPLVDPRGVDSGAETARGGDASK
jgi:hypothetical protein